MLDVVLVAEEDDFGVSLFLLKYLDLEFEEEIPVSGSIWRILSSSLTISSIDGLGSGLS